MRLNEYHFRTDWSFDAPIERVWDVVTDIQTYPRLWKDFRRINLVEGDGRSLGSLFECETKGSLPYTLRYTLEVVGGDPPHSIDVRSSGDLVGTGHWDFAEEGERTRATYLWDVGVTRPLLNAVAPLAKGLLARNHTKVMERGYAALRGRLDGDRSTAS